MNRLNFNHFFYFYIIAKEGSIKKASEVLFVSQPTISDQLKLLEEYFECKLFERQHRSLILTPEGEVALEYAQKVFELGNEVTRRLRQQIKIPRSSFDIGMTPYMSQYFLYDFILPLFDSQGIHINFIHDHRHLLLAELEEENIDIYFTDDKNGLPANLEFHRVGVNRTYVVAHKKYRKYKKNFPHSLNEIPFYSYAKNSTLKHDIEMFFVRNNITPQVKGYAEDIDLYQLITEKGIAFTIVPEIAKNRFCQNRDVIVLGEIKELQASVWGIIKKSQKGLARNLLKNKLT